MLKENRDHGVMKNRFLHHSLILMYSIIGEKYLGSQVETELIVLNL